jgi:ubiquinol-cytochrome c reductase cytochrome b subunit
MKRVVEFFESRTGLSALWRAFADEPVPVRRAWLFTLGSAALFALLVQLLTGLALALAYAPTPDHAFESVKAIQTRLPAGGLVRGLHHWGASAIVVLAVLHLLRTFLFGAYKKPRELNWVVGVALLLVILAFGFTGYLLPWDQKAYWATVVGTRVPSALPVVGPAASRVIAGGPAVGAATLTRFYAVHVVLLPIAALLLVLVHLFLLRKHGHAGATTEPDPRQPFFPYQAARDALVGLGVVAVLFVLASSSPAPLERIADPTDTAYVPRPDWYFLPLFQLLKLFKGPFELLGTAILPGLSMLLLALVPWLDRGASRRPSDRRLVLVSGGLVGAGLLALLVFGALDAPKVKPPSGLGESSEPPDPRLLGGLVSYEKRGCASCHGVEGRIPPPGATAAASSPASPAASLVPLAARSHALAGDAFVLHVKEKSPKPPPGEEGGEDPDKDVPSLVAYVEALREGAAFATLPAPIRAGGAAIDREDCRQCHQIYGEGGRRGPALQHLLGKRDKAWLVEHFKDPKKLVPGSKMPKFAYLGGEELSAMADYLLALP